MSFEALVAKDGRYHQADVEMVSDSRNWPRPKKQQNPQQDTNATNNEEINVASDTNAAIADDENVE